MPLVEQVYSLHHLKDNLKSAESETMNELMGPACYTHMHHPPTHTHPPTQTNTYTSHTHTPPTHTSNTYLQHTYAHLAANEPSITVEASAGVVSASLRKDQHPVVHTMQEESCVRQARRTAVQ